MVEVSERWTPSACGPWCASFHVTGAVVWVGGQLVLSRVVLPVARRMLSADAGDTFAAGAGRRFGLLTGAVFLPLPLGTGWAMAWHNGVTRASLTDAGYGRALATKLGLFALVMLAAAGHGVAYAKGRPALARALAVGSPAGSPGVVLLATALPAP
ncbi:hypothetical protein [Streptomyces hygroscopicus]|uniref:hypothetical protein n=1 Tax=Streptomyces hygroscopicus TaxID=1912 RepID=UPI001ABFCF05|nr:hypothetical protein [Streptomyces hygroscopicus]